MTDQQADSIYGTIVNSLVACDGCGDHEDMLSLRATEDGRLICSEFDTAEVHDSPSIEMLIRAETDIEQLRRALVGDPAD